MCMSLKHHLTTQRRTCTRLLQIHRRRILKTSRWLILKAIRSMILLPTIIVVTLIRSMKRVRVSLLLLQQSRRIKLPNQVILILLALLMTKFRRVSSLMKLLMMVCVTSRRALWSMAHRLRRSAHSMYRASRISTTCLQRRSSPSSISMNTMRATNQVSM